MRSALRVLVVGAGPTGLTAAIELARRGIEVRLIERRKTGSGLSRAVGLLPSSLALLQPSGAAHGVRAEAIAYRSVVIHHDDALLAEVAFPQHDPHMTIHGLAQDRTEHHLRGTLESFGAQLDYSHELISLRQMAGRVVAGIRPTGSDHAVSDEFDYLVGADGVHSTVRGQLSLDFKGYELDRRWSIADVDCDGWDTSRLSLYLGDTGTMAVVAPMERNRVRVVANTERALDTLPVPLKVVGIRRESTFNIAVRQVSEYAVGRVFLAGDAAHCHSPVGGRGMNLGIADAADLAARLSVDQADGYHRARHAAGRATIADSERTRKLLMSRNRLLRGAVQNAFRAVNRYEFMQRRVMRGLLGTR